MRLYFTSRNLCQFMIQNFILILNLFFYQWIILHTIIFFSRQTILYPFFIGYLVNFFDMIFIVIESHHLKIRTQIQRVNLHYFINIILMQYYSLLIIFISISLHQINLFYNMKDHQKTYQSNRFMNNSTNSIHQEPILNLTNIDSNYIPKKASAQIDMRITNNYLAWQKNFNEKNHHKISMFKVPQSVKKAYKIQKLRKNLIRYINTEPNNQRLKSQTDEENIFLKYQFIQQNPEIQIKRKKQQKIPKIQKYHLINHDRLQSQWINRPSYDRCRQIIETSCLKYIKNFKYNKKKKILQKLISGYEKSKVLITPPNLLNINSFKLAENKQREWSLNFINKSGFTNLIETSFQNNKRFNRRSPKTILEEIDSKQGNKKNIGQQKDRNKKNSVQQLRQNHSLFPPPQTKKIFNIQKQLTSKIINSNKPFTIPFEKYPYRDFLWKLCYSHKISIEFPLQLPKLFRFYIGPGNNKMLVKGLLKRRSWWILTEKVEESNFIWTQIKIKDIFQQQKKNQSNHELKIIDSSLLSEKKQNQSLINKKILPNNDLEQWIHYWNKNKNHQSKLKQTMAYRTKMLCQSNFIKIKPSQLKIHNHLENNYIIGNKKALFHTMSTFYQKTNQNIFDHLPLTFHIQSGLQDPNYLEFLKVFYEKSKQIKKYEKQEGKKKLRNIWIVKPGQFTNRGNGITVCLNLQEIKIILKNNQKHPNGKAKTYIVQQYIDRPFLYCKRKFDIRHYMMITSVNGIIRGYWYKQGYIRTTSFEYSLKTNLTGIHLTNDAIQKYLPEYGKYQKGNKLIYQDFQKYLDKQYPNKYNFFEDVYKKMKKIATDATKASFMKIDPQKREHNFQIFGMDFMIDQNFNPWLLEINTNPCLQLSCPLLAKIIPEMVQNALRIGLDPLFPPPLNFTEKKNYFNQNILETNKFELIFDSLSEGDAIIKLYDMTNIKNDNQISQDDEVYEDEGKQLDQN